MNTIPRETRTRRTNVIPVDHLTHATSRITQHPAVTERLAPYAEDLVINGRRRELIVYEIGVPLHMFWNGGGDVGGSFRLLLYTDPKHCRLLFISDDVFSLFTGLVPISELNLTRVLRQLEKLEPPESN